MNSNIELKNLWHKQQVETPNVEKLYAKANELKRKSLIQLTVVNLALLLTVGFIGFIWYYYQPELLTTKIGIVLTILAVLIFLLPFGKQFSILTQSQTESNSKEYLQQLIKLKQAQMFQQTTMLSVYFIMLPLGVGLYLFEYVIRMPLIWGVFTYVLTALWFGFTWFYLRPRTIRKQNAKLNELLEKFEELNHQLTE